MADHQKAFILGYEQTRNSMQLQQIHEQTHTPPTHIQTCIHKRRIPGIHSFYHPEMCCKEQDRHSDLLLATRIKREESKSLLTLRQPNDEVYYT